MPTQRFFDIRFYIDSNPHDSQIRELAESLKEMISRGRLTSQRIGWQGLNQDSSGEAKVTSQDPNVSDQVDFKLFDAESTYLYLDDQYESRWADAWFERLERDIRPCMQRRWKSNDVRVKIAILDSGFDSSHPLFLLPQVKERFVEYKSFIGGTSAKDKGDDRGDYDVCGHGTHGAWLIHSVAPDADIYIAKVTRDTGYPTDFARQVAQAIKHATSVWEVDIISMSFGFLYPVPIVEEEIKQAQARNIFMFAAASNDGASRTVPYAYPARASASLGIFCVHSTDGKGNASKFTPPARENDFATLGEAVRSAWPWHLRKGLEKRQAGTSTATPIAASIAALILSFAAQKPQMKSSELEKLKTYQGMAAVLKKMSVLSNNGYRYLNPANLFDKSKEHEDIFFTIRSALNDV